MGSTRLPYIQMRGFRFFNPLRCTLLITCIAVIVIVLFIGYNINSYIAYRQFIEVHPFSPVAFWEDNRTISRKALLPVSKIEDVDLSNATIAIGACCRNVRKHLQGFRRNLAAITALFGHHRIYLYESDSNDQTLRYLREWQQNDTNHVRVHSEGAQMLRMPSRTLRLAACRNSVLQQARDELSSFDYYFMIDVDVGASSSFEVKNFLTNFIYPSSSWIAMTATQKGHYYDIWALRSAPTLTYDCWIAIIQLRNIFTTESFLTKHIIGVHQKGIPPDVPLIEVQSAFGGAALYNAKYLEKKCRYYGSVGETWWNTYDTCEHVPFHHCLQQHAEQQKIYINPQFQIF